MSVGLEDKVEEEPERLAATLRLLAAVQEEVKEQLVVRRGLVLETAAAGSTPELLDNGERDRLADARLRCAPPARPSSRVLSTAVTESLKSQGSEVVAGG